MLGKKFTPYPPFMVYDFDARLVPLSRHIEISVAVHDTLSKEREEEPVYLADKNPERLIERFIEALTGKEKAIAADVLKQHPYSSDFQISKISKISLRFPDEVKKQWEQWVNQVPLIGFDSGKYDLDIVKKYFVQDIHYNKVGDCNDDVFAAEKENEYMFLTTSKFKFLDFKNCIGPGLSYDGWCKSMGCRLQKLVFP